MDYSFNALSKKETPSMAKYKAPAIIRLWNLEIRAKRLMDKAFDSGSYEKTKHFCDRYLKVYFTFDGCATKGIRRYHDFN